MKSWFGPALVAAAIAGVAGFAIGLSAARRADPNSPAPGRPHEPSPAAPSAEDPARAAEAAPSAAAPSADPSAPVPKTDAPRVSPKDRLFAMVLPLLSDDEKHSTLWGVFARNQELQNRLFDLLMATEDPEILEVAQDLLISNRNPDLVKRMATAFASEANRDRKAMLAHALGGNFRSSEAQATVEGILSGGDVLLQERALARLSVQEASGEVLTRILPQLRDLVLTGATSNIRSRAAGALRGDVSEEGVRFLIERMLTDRDPEVQHNAMVALPITWGSPVPLPEEHASALWTVVKDEARSRKMRRWAAGRLLQGGLLAPNQMTEDQKSFLKSLVDQKN